ncbi:hypothetical protein [Spirosoma sp.]|uniref:hypothetical protein n=1 Tax=Spirosoma sp. TaxID=1899569 RepID=UPI00262CAC71|nr:hypothetical protein [Spirosoma sp.]MCX6218355.1 hypothetical protein [Spirosoma sp.]
MDPATYWAPLIDAYEAAMLQLPAEIIGFIGGRVQNRFSSFSRMIGEIDSTTIVSVSGSTAGIEFRTNVLKGGSLVIDRLGLLLNANVDALPVTVRKNGVPIRVWTLDVAMLDSASYDVTPLKLETDGSTYSITYPLLGGYYPRNNQLSCNCGNKDYNLNLVLATPLRSINGNLAHGLLLHIYSECDFTGLVCDLLANNQYTAAIGYMLYYKTGLNVIDQLENGQLSPYTQIREGELEAKKAEWTAKMSEYITWLTQNWSGNIPDQRCYLCQPGLTMHRGTLTL